MICTLLYTNTSRLKYMYRNGLKISEWSFKKIFFYLSFCLLSKTFWLLREISISFLLTILSASQILRSLEWRKWSPTKEALDFYTNSSCEHIIFSEMLVEGLQIYYWFFNVIIFQSVWHENSYKDKTFKHCFGLTGPEFAGAL